MNILVISTHPDDETLGCGGTLLKHEEKGDKTFWLIATTPLTVERKKTRDQEIKKVKEKYKFCASFQLNYPTTKLDIVPKFELVQKISKIIDKIKPDIVYLPNRSDVHSDHKTLFETAYSCTKNFRKPFIKKVLMYETLTETEFAPPLAENAFVPNVFVDTSQHMKKKLEIMQIYESEVMPDNLPRSISAIKSLAGYRGSRIGVKYAEAFMLLFEKQ